MVTLGLAAKYPAQPWSWVRPLLTAELLCRVCKYAPPTYPPHTWKPELPGDVCVWSLPAVFLPRLDTQPSWLSLGITQTYFQSAFSIKKQQTQGCNIWESWCNNILDQECLPLVRGQPLCGLHHRSAGGWETLDNKTRVRPDLKALFSITNRVSLLRWHFLLGLQTAEAPRSSASPLGTCQLPRKESMFKPLKSQETLLIKIRRINKPCFTQKWVVGDSENSLLSASSCIPLLQLGVFVPRN